MGRPSPTARRPRRGRDNRGDAPSVRPSAPGRNLERAAYTVGNPIRELLIPRPDLFHAPGQLAQEGSAPIRRQLPPLPDLRDRLSAAETPAGAPVKLAHGDAGIVLL